MAHDEQDQAAPELDDPCRAVHVGTVRREPSSIDFSGFVLSLAQTVMIELGEAPHPDAGHQPPDLAMARQSIDILAMLGAKTAGNLSRDESKLLEDTLYQVRMSYCEVRRAKL